MPRFTLLADWLAWQETLHPRKIDLGLERITRVAGRMQLLTPRYGVITVAGTNGKGSSIAMLEAILLAAGYRVGCYSSPHLLRYNERIRVGGREVDDVSLCRAFESVDQARRETSLSYFEFGTLAAFTLFRQSSLDIALLEVGLGGRLDAVNIIDTDAALVTSIDIDHCNWLGNNRELIGREKAGIFRAKRPAICSDPDAPASVSRHARDIAANWYALGSEFEWTEFRQGWNWKTTGRGYAGLPLPALPGKHQLDNAAGVLMTLDVLSNRFKVSRHAIEQGLETVTLPGRCQLLAGPVETLLDVAHNPGSAARLAQLLRKRPAGGYTRLVLGMLTDKDIAGFVAKLAPLVDEWYLATLSCTRGLSAEDLQQAVYSHGIQGNVQLFQNVETALGQAYVDAGFEDRIVVCGSFATVAEALSCHV